MSLFTEVGSSTSAKVYYKQGQCYNLLRNTYKWTQKYFNTNFSGQPRIYPEHDIQATYTEEGH